MRHNSLKSGGGVFHGVGLMNTDQFWALKQNATVFVLWPTNFFGLGYWVFTLEESYDF